MSAQKRRAEDDLRSEQRLAKRFDLLNLGTTHQVIPSYTGIYSRLTDSFSQNTMASFTSQYNSPTPALHHAQATTKTIPCK